MEIASLWGFSDNALAAIGAAVEGENIGGGPHLTRYYNPKPSRVSAMEAEACEFLGSKYALAVHSGTSALETAYVAAEVGPGCEAIVPAYVLRTARSSARGHPRDRRVHRPVMWRRRSALTPMPSSVHMNGPSATWARS